MSAVPPSTGESRGQVRPPSAQGRSASRHSQPAAHAFIIERIEILRFRRGAVLGDRQARPVRYANQLPEPVERLIVATKRDKPHWERERAAVG